MFTFFSKKKSQKIVEKIHNEIDTAQERLLQEAKRIIETNKPDDNKVERLKAVGFTSAAPVIKHDSASKILVEGFHQAKLIEYYKQNYPFQKFLTESELNRICEKYGLIYAPVNRYLGDVPEKNLRDIERMPSLRPEDEVSPRIYCKLKYHGPLGVGVSAIRAKLLGLPNVIEDCHFNHWSECDKYMKEKYNLTDQYIVDEVENITEEKGGLFIAAPIRYFNLSGLSKKGKYSFLKISSYTIKDPIVFRCVRGGIQVITKWGLEASDEALTNEIEN